MIFRQISTNSSNVTYRNAYRQWCLLVKDKFYSYDPAGEKEAAKLIDLSQRGQINVTVTGSGCDGSGVTPSVQVTREKSHMFKLFDPDQTVEWGEFKRVVSNC